MLPLNKQKREREAFSKALKGEVEHWESMHEWNQTDFSWNRLTIARANFNLDYTNYMKRKTLCTKQKIHEFGNRPSKLLAYTIEKEQSQHTIKAIRTRDK